MRERFRIIFLDPNRLVLDDRVTNIGNRTSVAVCMRTVAYLAITTGAVGAIAIHNHPSGGVTPSTEDLTITRQLYHLLRTLEVRLFDHIIIGHKERLSMRAAGFL